jgi:hypothetical protein
MCSAISRLSATVFSRCGAKDGEIARRARPRPDVLPDRAQFRPRLDERGGDAAVVVDGLAHLRADHPLDRVRPMVLHLGLGRLQRAQRLVRHDHVAGHH